MIKKISAFLTLTALCVYLFVPAMFAVADDEVINIESEKDFLRLAASCTLDTWSQGKEVRLGKDLDFSNGKFTPIPIFGGVFDGQGHTIKGINIKKDASNYGLFRYIQDGAIVKDVNVEAKIIASGTKNKTGALAGVNSGTVIGCCFRGRIHGGVCTGGLIGVNNVSGVVNNCNASGIVYGEHYVGGIAGENFGQIILCSNSCSVNTVSEEIKLDIENLNLEKLISPENLADITDVGGICGYSSGIIQDCTNSGRIGIEHTGYNIGGICGRQAGYMMGCTNEGSVCGRKDVGGIVGQMEPYTVLEYSPSSLENARDRLDGLQSSIDSALASAANSKNIIHGRLSAIHGYVNEARSDADVLIGKTNDLINGEIGAANSMVSRISGLMKSLAPHLMAVSDCSNNIKEFAEEYKKSFDEISETVDGIDSNEFDSAVDSLIKAGEDLQDASLLLKDGLEVGAETVGDVARLKRVLKNLTEALDDFNDAVTNIDIAVNNVKDATNKLFENLYNQNTDESFPELIEAYSRSFLSIRDNLKLVKAALGDIADVVEKTPAALTDIDLGKLKQSLVKMSNAAEYLANAVKGINDSLESLQKAKDEFSASSEKLRASFKDIRKITDKIKTELDNITDAFSSISSIFYDYANMPEITFPMIDDDYISKKDKLSDSIENIIDLFGKLTDDSDQFAGDLIYDLERISGDMFLVTDAFTDAYENVKDKDVDSFTEDISDDDTQYQTNGKVEKSSNLGKVHGDLNVGGIVGAMAIEYDFDPEDDVTKRGDKSLNFVYKNKAVVTECFNSGNISAKKNCVGGIAGKEDLGSIAYSLACGKAESSSGNYSGGIAGYSESTLRNNYSKCIVSGHNYVGGIAGRGYNVYNCLAIPYIGTANEYSGAVCGYSEKECKSNYFVSDQYGGIDNISYSGKAEPVSYEDIMLMENVPEEFGYFTARFMVDGETFEEVIFEYGETLTEDKIPQIPVKENMFGKWDVENFENLKYDIMAEAEYTEYILALESEPQRGKFPIIIEEGLFGSDAALTLKEGAGYPKKLRGRVKEIWSASVSNDSLDINRVHFLPKQYEKGMEIYVNTGEKWEKTEYKKDGRYLVFEVSSDSFVFCTAEKSKRVGKVLSAVLAAVIISAMAIFIKIILEVKKEIGER